MSTPTEYDISPKTNLFIWGYFLFFAIAMYLGTSALVIYFQAEVEQELYLKVGSVKSKELAELRQQEQDALKGIEEAMEKVVRASN